MARFNRQVSYFAIALCVLGIVLIAFRHFVSGIPFLPGASQTLWAVEAKIQFEADAGPIQASFTLPNAHKQFVQVNERTASPGFGLTFVDSANTRVAQWSIRAAEGKQTLYYLTELKVEQNPNAWLAQTPVIEEPRFLGSTATAAGSVLSDAQEVSIDTFSLTESLITAFKSPNQQAQLLLQKATVGQRIVQLLMQSSIPAREIDVLVLKDGARQQPLRAWVQVFDGSTVRIFDPSGKYNPTKTPWLIWEQNDGGVIDLMGGHGATVGFSMLKKRVPIVSELRKAQAQEEPGLLDASIHSLPLSEQALFKGILLVPVGVLLVVLMRTLVGLKTSGTFMPVLIALAFMQTSLLTGLIGFTLIVGAGLVIRSYFSRHNLLLVARISLVIISVVLIMALFSVVAFRFGLSEGLKLTLFPMIILSWTIERMSILWEEEGAKEVALQGGGSLFVALLAYLVMSNGIVQHLTFHFLGLQFIFMAIVLICGSYTGYRLLELKRFRQFLDH